MFSFYTLFTIVWLVIFGAHLFQLRRNRNLFLRSEMKFEVVTVAVPLFMSLYSLLNMINWFNYELTGFTSAGVHFFQMLVTLLLRISCYTLIILAVKGYSSLRQTFTKMEWRTVMGLVMFGTMGDLISEASDTKDWRSYMLPMTYQVTLALYCLFTCWRQRRAIDSHFKKLLQVRKDYQQLVSPANLEYAVYRYSRLFQFQKVNLILLAVGTGLGLGGATWLRWRLANLPKESLAFPNLGIALLDQIQYLAIYTYFLMILLQDYLPPIKQE